MPSTAPSTPTTTTRVARVPYLNSVPYFHGLTLGEYGTLLEAVPRQLAQAADAGEVAAGLLPVVEFFRLRGRFERLGPFGIAVRGRAHSATLFSRVPLRQLDERLIAVTPESATTVMLLRLLCARRYNIRPTYADGRPAEAEALLLIGDEALRFQQANKAYPYETDLGFEWWLWQHLPFVFAVWAVRADAAPGFKQDLERALSGTLGVNAHRLPELAKHYAGQTGMREEDVQAYLAAFIYRLSRPEEEGMARFEELLRESHLL